MSRESDRPTPAYAEYAGLRALAEESVRRDGRFVDPVKLRMLESLPRDADWRMSVLGHGGQRTVVELHMLLLAHGQDINPPMPAWLAELREEQRVRREQDEQRRQARLQALDDAWAAIHTALGFTVEVAYNYSGPNHLETWTQGAVHILVVEDLRVGRLSRSAGQSLCWTPSRAGHLLFDGGTVAAEKRVPTCKACIRQAAKLAGGKPTEVLESQRR
jgi:hypothetical protein